MEHQNKNTETFFIPSFAEQKQVMADKYWVLWETEDTGTLYAVPSLVEAIDKARQAVVWDADEDLPF